MTIGIKISYASQALLALDSPLVLIIDLSVTYGSRTCIFFFYLRIIQWISLHVLLGYDNYVYLVGIFIRDWLSIFYDFVKLV